MTKLDWLGRGAAVLFVLTVLGAVLFPVYAVVVMSVSRAPGFSAVLTPAAAGLTTEHFGKVLLTTDADGRWLFLRQLGNSLLVSTLSSALGVLLSASAAYALSRLPFFGKGALLSAFLVTQMFPATLMSVPLYFLIGRLGLVDSLLGLVLVYATTALPFCVWMLKGYFDTIPKEIDEAAVVDGAGRGRIFWGIVLPLARPALAVTGLFAFLSAWNELILAATFLGREEAFTLPVALYRHVGSHGADWGAFAAGSLVVSIPVCLLFFALQKQLVGGLVAGSVK